MRIINILQFVNVEVTVAQKLNQGTIPKKGCNLFRVSFLVTFLDKQKSDKQNYLNHDL